jgi:hypothetical protein
MRNEWRARWMFICFVTTTNSSFIIFRIVIKYAVPKKMFSQACLCSIFLWTHELLNRKERKKFVLWSSFFDLPSTATPALRNNSPKVRFSLLYGPFHSFLPPRSSLWCPQSLSYRKGREKRKAKQILYIFCVRDLCYMTDASTVPYFIY